jgi:hypothetical protein
MRAPRLAVIVSTAALATAFGAQARQATPAQSPAQTQPATPAPAAASATAPFTDAELKKFNDAITEVRAVSDTLNGAQPTPEQQAEMARAVMDSGLEVTRFNAISNAVANDPQLAARIKVLSAPPPAPGSVAASITPEELSLYVAAMNKMRDIAAGTPNDQLTLQQQTAIGNVVGASGLDPQRFSAIADAVAANPGLRARANLERARLDGEAAQP